MLSHIYVKILFKLCACTNTDYAGFAQSSFLHWCKTFVAIESVACEGKWPTKKDGQA